jgi:hypothetical protein
MRSKCYTAICGLAITAATLGTPALASAHPNNDWIIFLLLWYLFGGGQMGSRFPAGPAGCCCPPGGQPLPAPAAPVPAPNGNGAMLRNGNGFMQRAPGVVNGGLPFNNGAMLRQPGKPNGNGGPGPQMLRQGNGLPAIGQKPAMAQKPGPGGHGKADGHGKAALQPGKPIGGKPNVGPLGGGQMPAIGGKPNGLKPGPGMKPAPGKPQLGRR